MSHEQRDKKEGVKKEGLWNLSYSHSTGFEDSDLYRVQYFDPPKDHSWIGVKKLANKPRDASPINKIE